MDKAKKKFRAKKEVYNEPRKGLSTIAEENSDKNIENELMATDNEAGAPAPQSYFEPRTIEDNVDYTEGGKVT